MDSRADRMDEQPVADTPEDVAVLYSWANLHGAKYRDFSASRREYRAQLRHRAAEQVREQELKAQADAEEAAAAAEAAAQEAQSAAMSIDGPQADSSKQQALREAGRASRIASAERVEAARRAEAAAVAEAASRRAEREVAEAHASARRQAARYSDSEVRLRESGVHEAYQVPGEISDPYVPHPHLQTPPLPQERAYERPSMQRTGTRPLGLEDSAPASAFSAYTDLPQGRPIQPEPVAAFVEQRIEQYFDPPVERVAAPVVPAAPPGVSPSSSQRRRQGYKPDDASGVRQIYRGPEFEPPSGEYVSAERVRPVQPMRSDVAAAPMQAAKSGIAQPAPGVKPTGGGERAGWPFSSGEPVEADFNARVETRGTNAPAASPVQSPRQSQPHDRGYDLPRIAAAGAAGTAAPAKPAVPPYAATAYATSGDPTRGRRVQDDLGYKPAPSYSEPSRRTAAPSAKSSGSHRASYASDPSGPAWLYAPQTPSAATQGPPRQVAGVTSSPSTVAQSSVADTLQHSRERVAARWYALKGVFEAPGQEQVEAPVRQKETKTPVLAVFSLAGGVGKTSLVATLGRALSSLGEKVLLTDTTSHGLLPFYFGASELRQGVVRTFSPPSGSTDAPIYLVSYDVDDRGGDEAAQEQLVEEIRNNSKGTHRILLDLTPNSGWVARRMARMNPTVLVPVAADMNSVISLQAVEKYFNGTVDSDGRPVQPYYVINQFDASLPLHLDVREVLRRQLGDRLLPFVIRRAPSVSEALAEGMTVVDYAPETPVAEDYQNVAAWLRTIAAPATAGFRNVRWSER